MQKSQAVVALVMVCVGFAGGWYSQAWYKSAQEQQPDFSKLLNQPQSSDLVNSDAANQLEEEEETLSPLVLFNTELQRQAFESAMLVYDDIINLDEGHQPQLSLLVRQHLQVYLKNNDNEPFMALIDQYLSRRYDDTQVLLLLAEFQFQQGFPDEAARVMQLAFTYTYEPAQRESVSQSFRQLVTKTDEQLSGLSRWVELQGFYQLLENINLIEPEHVLRQAKVYKTLDDTESAVLALQSVIDDPVWGEKARIALNELSQGASEPDSTTASVVSIPLQRRGNHYLVNVNLNGQSDVVLMIDTGASVTSLTERSFMSFKDRHRFYRRGYRLFNTANGVTKGSVYQTERLSLGGMNLGATDLAVLDYQSVDGVDGLLGMNVLQHFRFEIDQDKALLLLRPR